MLVETHKRDGFMMTARGIVRGNSRQTMSLVPANAVCVEKIFATVRAADGSRLTADALDSVLVSIIRHDCAAITQTLRLGALLDATNNEYRGWPRPWGGGIAWDAVVDNLSVVHLEICLIGAGKAVGAQLSAPEGLTWGELPTKHTTLRGRWWRSSISGAIALCQFEDERRPPDADQYLWAPTPAADK